MCVRTVLHNPTLQWIAQRAGFPLSFPFGIDKEDELEALRKV